MDHNYTLGARQGARHLVKSPRRHKIHYVLLRFATTAISSIEKMNLSMIALVYLAKGPEPYGRCPGPGLIRVRQAAFSVHGAHLWSKWPEVLQVSMLYVYLFSLLLDHKEPTEPTVRYTLKNITVHLHLTSISV